MNQFCSPLFRPKIPSKKFMWVPCLHPFPGNEARNFSGVHKVYVENVYKFFLSLLNESRKTLLQKSEGNFSE